MRRTGMIGILLAAGMSVSACATHDRYGYGDGYGDNRQLRGAATGAAVGAAGGAALGAVIGGVSPLEGAAAGAVAGGVLGAATTSDDGRTRGGDYRWYRDDRGRCFYVDRDGYRRYDDRVRC